MTRIVVGVDGSDFSAQALHWAAREGTARSWTVTAVLAWDFLDQPSGQFDPGYGEDEARARLDQTVRTALGDGADPVEQVVVNGRPAEALLDQAGPDDLLVVGARGLGGFQRLMLGSTSEQVLHHARGPVAVVRGGTADGATSSGPGRVVVGVDDSDTAAEALAWAAEAARAHGARLEVVHAWRVPAAPADPIGGGAFIDVEAFEQAARTILDQAVARVDTTGLAGLDALLVDNSAAAALVEQSEGAHLLVVGSRGLGGFRGLLMGSVSHQLAHHAVCPTVVVPHAERRG